MRLARILNSPIKVTIGSLLCMSLAAKYYSQNSKAETDDLDKVNPVPPGTIIFSSVKRKYLQYKLSLLKPNSGVDLSKKKKTLKMLIVLSAYTSGAALLCEEGAYQILHEFFTENHNVITCDVLVMNLLHNLIIYGSGKSNDGNTKLSATKEDFNMWAPIWKSWGQEKSDISLLSKLSMSLDYITEVRIMTAEPTENRDQMVDLFKAIVNNPALRDTNRKQSIIHSKEIENEDDIKTKVTRAINNFSNQSDENKKIVLDSGLLKDIIDNWFTSKKANKSQVYIAQLISRLTKLDSSYCMKMVEQGALDVLRVWITKSQDKQIRLATSHALGDLTKYREIAELILSEYGIDLFTSLATTLDIDLYHSAEDLLNNLQEGIRDDFRNSISPDYYKINSDFNYYSPNPTHYDEL